MAMEVIDMRNRRAPIRRLSGASLEHLHSELRRLAEEFSLRLLDTIATSPVNEIPVPPAVRRKRGRQWPGSMN